MSYSIELFTVDDFPIYEAYAEDIVTEFNAILQDEINKKHPSSAKIISHLKKDMLNNPDVYLSDSMLAKLYIEKTDTHATQHALK